MIRDGSVLFLTDHVPPAPLTLKSRVYTFPFVLT